MLPIAEMFRTPQASSSRLSITPRSISKLLKDFHKSLLNNPFFDHRCRRDRKQFRSSWTQLFKTSFRSLRSLRILKLIPEWNESFRMLCLLLKFQTANRRRSHWMRLTKWASYNISNDASRPFATKKHHLIHPLLRNYPQISTSDVANGCFCSRKRLVESIIFVWIISVLELCALRTNSFDVILNTLSCAM